MTPDPPTRDADRALTRSGRPDGGRAVLEEALGTDAATLGVVVSRMECPACDAPVKNENGDIRCANGHVVPVVDGYLDASGSPADNATARTFASFGYEWTTFSEIQEEDERYSDHYLRDLELGKLAGSIGLDAGCGRARYTRFLAPHLDAVIALDGSDAAVSAARNLRDVSNAVVVRSDLREAPFRDDSFGFIASFGVLHHLEDPRAGFDRLLRLLRPGGVLSLYVYSRPERAGIRGFGLAAAAALRRLTVRLPRRILRPICTPIAAVLLATIVAPGRLGDVYGITRLSALPMRTYRDKPFRSLVLDTFDRLSAPIEHRFTWPELAPWFVESGLVVDTAREDSGWFIVAHRPAR
jgi:SAM-dependent methyltransferase